MNEITTAAQVPATIDFKAKMEAYRMRQTQNMPNLKQLAGETIKVLDHAFSIYEDANGTEHHVLALKTDRGLYRTEVAAFQRDFTDFVSVFEDPAERPAITIIEKSSKKSNVYISFMVEEAE